jgi:hypothetical protein
MPKSSATSVPDYPIDRRIHMVRGQKVLLDSHLAELYGVKTHRLNEAVKRNAERFPETFMFRLSHEEAGLMRSQFAISSSLVLAGLVISCKVFVTSSSESTFRKGDCRREMVSPVFSVSSNTASPGVFVKSSRAIVSLSVRRRLL